MSNSLWTRELYSPWNFPHQNAGVGSLLQGIFITQGSNPSLPHSRQILYRLSYQGMGNKSPGEGLLLAPVDHRTVVLPVPAPWWPWNRLEQVLENVRNKLIEPELWHQLGNELQDSTNHPLLSLVWAVPGLAVQAGSHGEWTRGPAHSTHALWTSFPTSVKWRYFLLLSCVPLVSVNHAVPDGLRDNEILRIKNLRLQDPQSWLSWNYQVKGHSTLWIDFYTEKSQTHLNTHLK